jgi:hypothetical protein
MLVEWKELYNKELHDLYRTLLFICLFIFVLFNSAVSSSDCIALNHIIVRVVKSRKLNWVGHIATWILLGKLFESGHQGDWRIILK